jgi:TPR repeat protein
MFRKAAENNHAKAQYNIGFMYEHGRGVVQNYHGALTWYRKAADQGDAAAQNEHRQHVRDWTRRADGLRRGDQMVSAGRQSGRRGRAQTNIGSLYASGRGVEANHALAFKWYLKAAQQGDAVAQNHVGNMYATGQGWPENYSEAVNWYTKAAERGDPGAQNNLGSMFAAGKAVPRDLVQAHKWYTLAAAHFPPDEAAFPRQGRAQRRLDRRRRMTAEQIGKRSGWPANGGRSRRRLTRAC